MTLLQDIFETWTSPLDLLSSFSPVVFLSQDLQDFQLPKTAIPFAMAWPPTLGLACDDEANPALADINSDEWVASYPNNSMSNLTSSADTYAVDWPVDATIDPTLLTQRHISNDNFAYDAYLQQP